MARESKRAAKTTDGDSVKDAIDSLYAVPLADFVRARRELSTALRAAGDSTGARRVADVAKPSRASWAINQVARRHEKLVKAMLDARQAVEEAQSAGGADRIRTALTEFRARMNDLVRAARGVLREAGIAASATLLREVTEGLRTASADEGFLRRRLIEGRLAKEAREGEVDLLAALASSTRSANVHERADARKERKDVAPESTHGRERERRETARAQAARAREEARERARKAREEARERARKEASAKAHAAAVAKAKHDVDVCEREAAVAHAASEKADERVSNARAALKRLQGDATE